MVNYGKLWHINMLVVLSKVPYVQSSSCTYSFNKNSGMSCLFARLDKRFSSLMEFRWFTTNLYSVSCWCGPTFSFSVLGGILIAIVYHKINSGRMWRYIACGRYDWFCHIGKFMLLVSILIAGVLLFENCCIASLGFECLGVYTIINGLNSLVRSIGNSMNIIFQFLQMHRFVSLIQCYMWI